MAKEKIADNIIVNSGEFGAQSDGAKPICIRGAGSNDVPNFSSIDYNTEEASFTNNNIEEQYLSAKLKMLNWFKNEVIEGIIDRVQKIKFNWAQKAEDLKPVEEKIKIIHKGVIETGETIVKLFDTIFKSYPTTLKDPTNRVEEVEASSVFPTAEEFAEEILAPFIERGDFAETSQEAQRYRKNLLTNLKEWEFQKYSFWNPHYIMVTTFVVSYAHHLRRQDKENQDKMIELLTDEEFKIYLKKDFETFCLLKGISEENCPTPIRIAQEEITKVIDNLSLEDSLSSSLIAELEDTNYACSSSFG